MFVTKNIIAFVVLITIPHCSLSRGPVLGPNKDLAFLNKRSNNGKRLHRTKMKDYFSEVRKKRNSFIATSTMTTILFGETNKNRFVPATFETLNTHQYDGVNFELTTTCRTNDPQSTSEFELTTTSRTADPQSTSEFELTSTSRTADPQSTSEFELTSTRTNDPQSTSEFELTTTSRTADPQSTSEFELATTSRTADPQSTSEFELTSTSRSDDPQSTSEFELTSTSRTADPQSTSEFELTSTRTAVPQSTSEFELTSTNRTDDPESTSEFELTSTSRSDGPQSTSDVELTTPSVPDIPQSTSEFELTTTSGTEGPETTYESESTMVNTTIAALNSTSSTTSITTNKTVPCPRMCVCNQMSVWEKFVRQKMRLMDSAITTRYTWKEIGQVIAQKRIDQNPSAERVIKSWKSRLFKDVECHVKQNQELSLDLAFMDLAIDKGIRNFNLSFICSNDGKILVKDLSTFVESNFISIVNCSMRTNGYLSSMVSDVKISSVTIDNSTLSWLNNITISNTNRLYVMFIYNTPLNGHPRVIDRTEGILHSVYFKQNNIADTDCSFLIGTKNVSQIRITNNRLREIPSCLLTSAVTSLILSNNLLVNISTLFYPHLVRATNLTDLRLDHNLIEQTGMFSYMKLHILDLSYNKIQYLNKLTFNRLPHLTYLDLSWNRITKIPAGTFKAFFYLHFLNLSHNSIRDFSLLQSPLSHSDINIHHNQLVYPPFYRDGYSVVTAHIIKAESNPYKCDCEADIFKQHIADSKMNTKYKIQFKHLDEYKCFSPKSLHDQTLLSVNFSDVCPIVTDCPETCECSLNRTSHKTEIRCVSVNLTSLPLAVPEGSVVLLFSGNRIRNISTREYFTRAEKLNISGNALEQLDSPVCELWKHLQVLDISYNKIRYLPKCFVQFNASSLEIHMHGNPWVCDCNSLWMLAWFKDNKQYIPEHEKITCANEAFKEIQLANFPRYKLDCDPRSYLEIAIPLGVLALLAIALIPVAYKFRFETQMLIHARFHIRPFDGRKPEMEEYMYEVFLSYASENEAWIVHTLMPKLENRDPPYRVCVHYRDFEVGAAIADNILNAVQKSRSTLVILSKEYLASEWCTFEFQKAHHEVLKDRARKLVVILMDDIPMEVSSPELTTYLKRNTYLCVDDRWFWQKLFYCLPDPSKHLQHNRALDQDIGNQNMLEMVPLQQKNEGAPRKNRDGNNIGCPQLDIA